MEESLDYRCIDIDQRKRHVYCRTRRLPWKCFHCIFTFRIPLDTPVLHPQDWTRATKATGHTKLN